MFCPSCGTEERQPSQFCRACGADLRTVRTAVQRPDAITASANSAREEIGRAIAVKLETAEVKSLSGILEEVLPQVEKFLESPEERRLRRIRTGVVTFVVGLGLKVVFGWSTGWLVLLIGLGILINGYFFTVPEKRVPDKSLEGETQKSLEQSSGRTTNELDPPTEALKLAPPSVTENTTETLPSRGADVVQLRNPS